MQSQKAVSADFASKQIPRFGLATVYGIAFSPDQKNTMQLFI